MVLEAVHCPACAQPEAVYRHGKTHDGRQRYRCMACRRTFQLRYQHKIHEPGARQRITDMALNGSGVRETAWVLGISPQTVMGELKKIDAVNQRAPVRSASAVARFRLCADEMWSFVRRKKEQRWLWWVENASTGEVVAFVFGRRTHATFRRLLALLTEAARAVAQWLIDAWGAYAACLPAVQHQVGKVPMQRLERKHLTLRTRLKRLARRMICFSKKQFFHDGLIR